MGQAGWVKDHIDRYRATNGAEGHIWDGLPTEGTVPCLLLTTTGRKSRTPQTTPLIYGRDGENYVVIASQGGRPTHPAWYLNLEADPQVELQVGADVFSAAAHSVVGEDRDRLWRMMAEIYPPYDDYQAKASAAREIPLVVLVRS